MTNTYRAVRILTICIATCITWFIAPAQAQNVAIAYEDGVNAYFAGRSGDAESYLSAAIEANSQDPRAYYFRALSLLCQGRTDLARGDLLTAATLEAQQPHRYSIGSALERIQGPRRLMLEEYRRQARLAAAPASSIPAATGATVPNPTFREGEADVIREKKYVPLEELLRPEGPRAIAVEPPTEPATRPVVPPQPGQPNIVPDAKTETPPATPPQPEKDPFADDSAAPAAPSTSPPPTPPTPPQDAPKPATPPAGEAENPFGG